MNFKILNLSDKDKVKSYIDKLPEGKKYDVSIKLKRVTRTFSQNRLHWLWLACIMAETGNDKDSLHEYFKDTYLPKESKPIFGKIIEVAVSTTSLNTAQFTHYLNRIQQFASSELGIILPDPEDLHFREFYENYKDFI